MDVVQKYFLVSLFIIAAVAGGGYYYHTEQMAAMQDYYDTQLQDVDNRLITHSMDIDQLSGLIAQNKEALATQIEQVSEDLSGELARVELESGTKIQDIQQDIMNIDVETRGFTQVIDQTKDSVVSIRTNLGYGSGVVVHKDGYVLTNYHVIEDINALSVVFFNGKRYTGRIAGFHRNADLALIKLGSENSFKPLFFADYDTLVTGQKVIAMGNPAGLDFSVTEGIISSTTRTNSNGYAVLQTSVPINPGNSGGPLVDGNGFVAGINTFKLGGYESLGFAMNPDTAKQFVELTIKQDKEKIEATENA